MNHEQPMYTSSMVATRMETTHERTWTYLFRARPIEATAWQSVDAVCHCCLTHSSCHCHWTRFS